ncbi:nose resistant to fluoxetine protein 6-like [Saccostrea cucullata]|uniref:nose resistant to fluoxetine protein 6-like n=1 Tax=Saccostrea cuccullata TaxID=36930 RepID=UPI002ED12164
MSVTQVLSDMYSKVLVFSFCLSVAFAEDTSYFEILNDVQSKISHVPKLRSESSEVSQIFTQIGNLHTLDSFDVLLNEIGKNIGAKNNITLCIDDLTRVLNATRQGEAWGLQVLDSFGKIQPGILMANFHSPGFYDECKNVGEQIPQNVTFISQYCSLNIPTKLSGAPVVFSFGLCVSERCSERDLDALIYLAMDLIPLNISFHPYVTCQKNHLEFDFKAVAAMVFAGFFVLLIFISTLLDILSSWMANNKIFETKSTSANGEVLHYAHRIGTEETPLLGSPTTELAKVNPMSGCLMRFFLAFSVYSNGKKLLSTKKTASTLGAVNGVRFFSMSWVILGHTLAFGLQVVSNLGYIVPILLKRRSYHVIINALVSVDSFFLLSGLLVSYLLLRELRRNEGKKINWVAFIAKFYFHRYWRLTPPLMLLMFVYVPLFQYVSDGPFWPQNGVEPGQCNKTWWHTMLYINNFYDEECMGWTWYLANDMQFFILSPFIIIPLYYSKWIGGMIGTSLLFGSWVATGIISNYYQLPASMLEQLTHPQSMQSDYFNIYYVKPYCRIGPYIVGILFGYLLYKTDCKLKINKVLNLFIWMVAATLACLVVYGLYDELNGYIQMSQGVKDLYNTTHRTVWGACVGWVIFSCATGNGGFINTLLSWSFFSPLARLTYFAYLVHPILIIGYYFSLRSTFYMDDATLAVLFVAVLVFTYMAAFILSLAFEAPMLGLEKIIFNRDSPQEEKKATSDSKHKE